MDEPAEKKIKVSITNLWKSFNGNEVLKGINLQIYQGETLTILGGSGIGKSVLLRQIMGLSPHDKGSITINGTSFNTLNKKEQAKVQMGMLFQGGALFDSMTVAENVAFYLKNHPSSYTAEPLLPNELEDRIAQALSMVGLTGIEHKMPSDLSGGMRKRVALARLLIYRPTLILYDEPTTGLDPILATQINELIIKIKNELQATSIVVTHDIPSALQISDRIALLDKGEIALVLAAEEFVKTEHPIVNKFLEYFKQPQSLYKDSYHVGKD